MPPAPDPAPEADMGGQSFQLVIAADPLSVRDGLACLTAAAPVANLPADHRATTELVLAEVLNNVAEHAYPLGGGTVAVSLRLTGIGLSCLVADTGLPMPDGTLPKGFLPRVDLPEGGFGWHLIRSLTQNLHYARSDGQNRLSFVIPV
jgi:serine/threonine-protein kinase RsbW